MPWDLACDRRAMAGFVILTNPVHERHGMPKASQSLGRAIRRARPSVSLPFLRMRCRTNWWLGLKRIPYPADEQTVRRKGARIAARLKAADDTWQKERFEAGAAWGDHCPGRTRQALEAGHHVRALCGDGAPRSESRKGSQRCPQAPGRGSRSHRGRRRNPDPGRRIWRLVPAPAPVLRRNADADRGDEGPGRQRLIV
jgi:hypothetical protein